MYVSMMEDYVDEQSKDSVSVAWNRLQVFHQTCGVNGPHDWQSSSWLISLQNDTAKPGKKSLKFQTKKNWNVGF